MSHPASRKFVGWPGFGGLPERPDVRTMQDLVQLVTDELDQPTTLIAQSMGGVIAIQAALARPEQVTHLVLAATSGGVDVSDLHVEDWRPSYAQANPGVPRWFLEYGADLSASLALVGVPVLLLWGDADPISPIAVGFRLQQLFPRSRLHVIAGGDHDLANELWPIVAPLIDEHLSLVI
jgi:poly(3-hydroxyoctanoate) depolymerase